MRHQKKRLSSKTRVASRIQRHNHFYNTKEGQRISMLNKQHNNKVKIVIAIIVLIAILYLTLPETAISHLTAKSGNLIKKLPGLLSIFIIFALAFFSNIKKSQHIHKKKSLFNPLHVYTFVSQHPRASKSVLTHDQLKFLAKKIKTKRATFLDLMTLKEHGVLNIQDTFVCLDVMGYLPQSLPVTSATVSNYSTDQLEQIVSSCWHFYQKHLTAEDIVYAYIWRMITPHQAWSLLQKAPVRLLKTEINVLDDNKSPEEILSVFHEEEEKKSKKTVAFSRNV